MRQLWRRNQKSASCVVPGEGAAYCHAFTVNRVDVKVIIKVTLSVVGLSYRFLSMLLSMGSMILDTFTCFSLFHCVVRIDDVVPTVD
jgi:hypothetical protein